MQSELSLHSETSEDASFDPEIFITERAERARELNDFCERWYEDKNSVDQASFQHLFGTHEPAIQKTIETALDAFRQPKAGKGNRRKDGSFWAVHSLELYQKAKRLDAQDSLLLQLLLLHDVLEDTETSQSTILGLKGGKDLLTLVQTMTEQRAEGLSREQSVRAFIEQVQTAKRVPTEQRILVRYAEVFDRLDDISDIEYLTRKLETGSYEEQEKTRAALVKKFAKCRFEVESVTKDSVDLRMQNLKTVFDRVFAYQTKKWSISESDIAKDMESFYEAKKYS